MKKLLLIAFLSLINLCVYSQSNPGYNERPSKDWKKLHKHNKEAFENLKRDCGGVNWKVKDLKTLVENGSDKSKPYLELHLSTFPPYHTYISGVYLVNNNLVGEMTKDFWQPYKGQANIESLWITRFSVAYNKIEKVDRHWINRWDYQPQYCKIFDFSHNKLTEFKSNRIQSLYGHIKELDLSCNEITRLKYKEFATNIDGTVNNNIKKLHAINVNWKHIDVSNNRMNFDALIEFTDDMQKLRDTRDNAINYKPDETTIWNTPVIYAPQKPIGDRPETKILKQGERTTLIYKLPHEGNKYQWQLNGKNIEGATFSEFNIIDFDETKAGHYNCLVTNPALPLLTISSYDFPVLINGTAEVKDFDLSNIQLPPNTFRGAIVGLIQGEGYFKLTETKHNESFEIVNGKILRSREKLFRYKSLQEYEVEIVCVNKYGQTKKKIFKITKGNKPDGAKLIEEFDIEKFVIDENKQMTMAKVFVKNGGVRIDHYNYELPANQMDNDLFELIGSNLIQPKNTTGLNYEKRSSYNLMLVAKHKTANLKYMQTLNLTIKDVNDTPYNLTLPITTLETGKSVNTIVSPIFAEDEDDNLLNYSLIKGTDYFKIENGFLRAKIKFTTSKIIDIKIKASDSKGGYVEKSFQIKVVLPGTVPENGLLILNNAVIDEGEPANTEIGELSVFNSNDIYNYVVASDDFGVINNKLVSLRKFDHEEKSFHRVKVTANSEKQMFVSTFVIAVNNINEQPTNIGLTNMTILNKENYEIGSIVVEDSDNSGHVLSLKKADGTDFGYFKIMDNKLYVAKKLDLDKNIYTLEIEVKDGELSYSSRFEFYVKKEGSETATESITGMNKVLSAYPTPVLDKLIITLDNDFVGQIKTDIFNINGVLKISRTDLKSDHEHLIEVNMFGLISGTYIARITSGNQVNTIKLVKK